MSVVCVCVCVFVCVCVCVCAWRPLIKTQHLTHQTAKHARRKKKHSKNTTHQETKHLWKELHYEHVDEEEERESFLNIHHTPDDLPTGTRQAGKLGGREGGREGRREGGRDGRKDTLGRGLRLGRGTFQDGGWVRGGVCNLFSFPPSPICLPSSIPLFVPCR